MIYIKPDIKKANDHYSAYLVPLTTRIHDAVQNLILNGNQNSRLFSFLNYLLIKSDNEEGSLYDLITALPERMEKIVNNSHLDLITNGRQDNENLKNIFSISYKDDLSDKANHIKTVGLDTCPYCNHAFIQTDNLGRGKHEIDHFYPQSIFPYFAMSYYNLIPACRSCNAMIGGKANTMPMENKREPFKQRIFNPYDVRVKDFKFNIKLNKIDDIWNSTFEIRISQKSIEDGYQKLFSLKTIYSHHNEYVQELYLKHVYLYSETHQEQLLNWINSNKKSINIDLYRHLYGFYEEVESYHKRPLSKMAGDMLSEIEELLTLPQ